MILAGDIGGTKTVLALYDDRLAPIREQNFDSANFVSLDAVVVQVQIASCTAQPCICQ